MNLQDNTTFESQSELATQLFHLLHRAGQGGDEVFLASFRENALTPRQFAVLTAAHESKDEPSQAALVADTGIDRSTLADIVGRLVDKGLLQRERTKRDARAYAIHVTDKGRETIAELRPRLAHIENQVLSALPDDERDVFVKNLERVVHALKDLQA